MGMTSYIIPTLYNTVKYRFSRSKTYFGRNWVMKIEPHLAGKMCPTVQSDLDGGDSLVQSFYAGASVLVTGGTGFMGKVLIEKLLWACPDITAIYVLVRSKKGLTAHERVEALLSSQCFDRLRMSRGPGFGSKLIPVEGDIAESRLGLSDLDLQHVAANVAVVIHGAATVRFDEPLHVAVTQNVRGTKELLELCRTFTRIKALVHVSTAFSHCPLLDIEERFYDSPMDCDEAIKMAAAGEITPTATESLLGPWPNTYSFTKALAEDVVRKHGHGLPVCVFRPSVVLPSFVEPVAGWIDNLAGSARVLAGVLTGFIRVLALDDKMAAALVPCDMAVDGMIVAAWDLARRGSNTDTLIYNFTPSPSNKVTWHHYFTEYKRCMSETPPSMAIWTPDFLLVPDFLLGAARLAFQTLPAGIADTTLFLTGRKPFASDYTRKFSFVLDVVTYFAKRQWRFQEKNVPALWRRLDQRDKAVFHFDMSSLDWNEYIKNTSPGVRQFLLRDDPSTIPAAKRNQNRILRVKSTFWALVYLTMMLYIVYKLCNVLSSPWDRPTMIS